MPDDAVGRCAGRIHGNMGENKKPLMYLITQDFPYGHLEDSFVGPEYPYLCERFDISIIAAEVPPDTELLSEEEVENKGFEARIISNRQKITEKLFSLFCFLLTKDCYTEIVSIIRSGKKIFRRIYRALMFGAAAETFYRRLKQSISLTRDTQALFYFYWNDYKCFGLAMHKHKYPKIRMAARTHGYDLYDERELYGKQFFKPQTDRRLVRLIFAAQYAKDYYLGRYRIQDSAKYPLYRLGVQEQNVTKEDRRHPVPDFFLLLSCSEMIPLKRVGLIIDGLAGIKDCGREIRWVHIGGGELLQELRRQADRKLADKTHIHYEFTGSIVNEEVVRFYREHYVGCFITTTSTEGGSPVSVQEALSFGVPVIATSVAELPHMVEGNGTLLSENPDADEVAAAIADMAKRYGTEAYYQMCERSLELYAAQFNAHRNFSALAEELERI